MRCLICGSALQGCLCPRCGFDQSACAESWPTLAPLAGSPVSLRAQQERWEQRLREQAEAEVRAAAQRQAEAEAAREETERKQAEAARKAAEEALARLLAEQNQARRAAETRAAQAQAEKRAAEEAARKAAREAERQATEAAAARMAAEAYRKEAATRKKRTFLWVACLLLVGAVAVGLALMLILGKGASDHPERGTPVPEQSPDTGPVGTAAETTAPIPAPVPGIHRYEFVQSTCTWKEAQAAAVSAGGHLVCFETQEELNHVIDLLDNGDSGLYYLRIGGRRDEDGTDYHWVDGQDALFGPALDPASGWYGEIWMPGEPTIVWKEKPETVMAIEYDWEDRRWYWNDVGNQIAKGLDEAIVGYIIEFED